MFRIRYLALVVVAVLALSGCSALGGSSASTPTPADTPTATPTPTPNATETPTGTVDASMLDNAEQSTRTPSEPTTPAPAPEPTPVETETETETPTPTDTETPSTPAEPDVDVQTQAFVEERVNDHDLYVVETTVTNPHNQTVNVHVGATVYTDTPVRLGECGQTLLQSGDSFTATCEYEMREEVADWEAGATAEFT